MARTTYRYDMRTAKVPPIDRAAYSEAQPFLLRLKHYRNALTFQQWKTLRGQALNGDVEGAEKGLLKILRDGEESGKISFATDRYHHGRGAGG